MNVDEKTLLWAAHEMMRPETERDPKANETYDVIREKMKFESIVHGPKVHFVVINTGLNPPEVIYSRCPRVPICGELVTLTEKKRSFRVINVIHALSEMPLWSDFIGMAVIQLEERFDEDTLQALKSAECATHH